MYPYGAIVNLLNPQCYIDPMCVSIELLSTYVHPVMLIQCHGRLKGWGNGGMHLAPPSQVLLKNELTVTEVSLSGVAWPGRVLLGLVGCCLAWSGVAWPGRVLLGLVGCCLAWSGVAWPGRVLLGLCFQGVSLRPSHASNFHLKTPYVVHYWSSTLGQNSRATPSLIPTPP